MGALCLVTATFTESHITPHQSLLGKVWYERAQTNDGCYVLQMPCGSDKALFGQWVLSTASPSHCRLP